MNGTVSGQDNDTAFGSRLHRIGLVTDLLRLSAVEAHHEIAHLIHPQMRMLAAPGVAPARRYETREDFLEYFVEAGSQGVLVEPDAYEIRAFASGSVLVSGRIRMSSPSGVDETAAWFVYTFRDRLIASLETYLDADLAAEAARDSRGGSLADGDGSAADRA